MTDHAKKTAPEKRPQDAREKSAETNRKSRRANRGSADVADWGNATPETIAAVISSVTARGCAVQFSLTRDGGSLCVRIVGDGEPYNEYVRPTEDVDEYLRGLAADFR